MPHNVLQVGTIDQKCDVLAVANDAYDAAAVIETRLINHYDLP